jgi:hypothetical protein
MIIDYSSNELSVEDKESIDNFLELAEVLKEDV